MPSRTPAIGKLEATLIALTITSTFFLFGPVRSYAANRDEFVLALTELLRLGLPGSIALFGLIFGALVIARGRAATCIASTFTALACLFYLQSSFLVWNYGLFDGEAIAWDESRIVGKAELVLWIGVLCLAVRYSNWVRSRAASLCTFILLAYTFSVAMDSWNASDLWQSKSVETTDSTLFRFSSERNVVVLVLDAFQTSTFEMLLAREPELREQLDGFVFFPENTAAFSTTSMSIPAMLTGEIYRNQEPTKEFLSRVLRERSLGNILATAGYRQDLLTLGRYCEYLSDERCRSMRSFEANDRRTIERSDASQLFELVLFRNSPHFVKQAMFEDGPGFSERLFGIHDSANVMQRSTLAIASAFRRESHVSGAQPSFKFVHYFLPHKPFRFDERCDALADEAVAGSDDAVLYFAQARCALELAIEFIDTLRALDIYDESMIVLAADHGMGGRKEFTSVEAFFGSVDRALPLLLVKPLRARGPLVRSANPTQVSDIPKSIVDEIALSFDYPGQSVFRAREPRKRSYLHYVWQHRFWDASHLPPLREFLIEGAVRDPASWHLAAEPLEPANSARATK